MKFCMFFLLPFFFVSATSVDTVSEARTLFKTAAFNAQSCASLMYGLKNYNENNNPTLAAYKACGWMMNAKYAINPLDKWNSFSKGKTLLQKSVSKAPQNVEVRFLRLAMQSKCPSFLGYSEDIPKDKNFVLQQFKSLDDTELKNLMKGFLEKSDILSASEKKIIENY